MFELRILTGRELDQNASLARKVFTHRYQVFVTILGWKALDRPDGLERDAFDTDEAIHFIVLHSQTGQVAAYSRLLATTRPHLLSTVLRSLLGDESRQPPVGEHIWEWTRTTAIPMPLTSSRKHEVAGLGFTLHPAGRILIIGITEWSLQHGITTLSLQCDPAFAGWLDPVGARAEILAKPSITTEGERVAPILMHISRATSSRMRKVFGLPRASTAVKLVPEESIAVPAAKATMRLGVLEQSRL